MLLRCLRGVVRRRPGEGFGLGAEVSDEFADLLVSYRIAEGRHFLAAVQDLVRDLLRRPGFVLPEIYEGRRFLGTDGADSMAVSTPFVAEEYRTLFFLIFARSGGGDRDSQDGYKEQKQGR